MKVDGKALAKEHASRKKQNMELEKEGHVVNKEQEEMGAHHLAHLSQFIEAIHHKDPEKAHIHMMNYVSALSKPMAGQDQPK